MNRGNIAALARAITFCGVVSTGCGSSDEAGTEMAGGTTMTGAQSASAGAGGAMAASTSSSTTMTGGVAGKSGAGAMTAPTTNTTKQPNTTTTTAMTMTPTDSGMMEPAMAGSAAGSPAMAGTAGAAGAAESVDEMDGAMGTAGADASAEASDNPFVRGADPADSLTGDQPGSFSVESYIDGYRNGPDYADSTIYYPTDAEPPFAAVAVVPGFVSPQSSIQSWGPFLASYGMVAMTIGTNLPTDAPEARKRALLDALETIKSENERSGGPLAGKIATDTLATMGWSMGGGGTLLVANENPDLKATVSLCGWNPGYPYSMIKSPALMFASLGDPLAGGQSQGFYRSIPDSTPKMLIELPGADHFVANNPASTRGIIGRYGLAWLKVFLEGDERYRKFLLQEPETPTTDYQSNVK